MLKKTVLLVILITFLWAIESPAAAPHELAGFVLGGRMRDFQDRVEMNTVLPVRYLESLKEVEAKEIKGYKTGLVLYGTCIEPSRIVRLKFKYADASKKFYEELLKRYKARFGDPDKWRGDPFHVVLAWKWRFTDQNGNRISLILQHNIRDEEEKEGNSVKMTMWNLILDEEGCFEKEHPDPAKPELFDFSDPAAVNWEPLIPKKTDP
jgi:hypothetical protein